MVDMNIIKKIFGFATRYISIKLKRRLHIKSSDIVDPEIYDIFNDLDKCLKESVKFMNNLENKITSISKH